jgi:hypothetical protein
MPDNAQQPDGNNWWQVTERHIPDITPTMAAQMNEAEIKAWREMPPEVCAQCVRARCTSCAAPVVSHMEPGEITRLSTQYGSLWPLAQLRYLGWQTDLGYCDSCTEALSKQVAIISRPLAQTLDLRQIRQ